MAKRKKNRMEKNTVMKYIVIPCTIAIVCSLIYLIWHLNNQNSTYSNIQYIQGFISSSGRLNDFQNKLGMHDSKEDIKWYKTDEEIRIDFGRIILTWPPEEFYDEKNIELIGTIGFTIEILPDDNGNKVLHLYYRGEEVERWVR